MMPQNAIPYIGAELCYLSFSLFVLFLYFLISFYIFLYLFLSLGHAGANFAMPLWVGQQMASSRLLCVGTEACADEVDLRST